MYKNNNLIFYLIFQFFALIFADQDFAINDLWLAK